MSSNSRQYVVALFGLDRVLRGVPNDRWDAPSPCEGWSVRDAAGHAMGVVSNIAGRLGRCELLDPFTEPGLIAGDDPYASWVPIRDRTLEAIDQQGALQHQITGSALGDMPLDDFLKAMMADALVHTWDIARAAGIDERLDDALVARVHEVYQRRDANGQLRVGNRFGAATVVGESASAQDRMLAFIGRKP